MTRTATVKKSIGLRRYRRLPKWCKDFFRKLDTLPKFPPDSSARRAFRDR